MMLLERIQKVLAKQGLGSRRQIEDWIERGRIQINGQKATLGQKVSPSCRILFDDKPVELKSLTQEVLLYHKPVGEICSRRVEAGTSSVFDNLPPPKSGKWIHIGRLDVNSSGLLLITNDGEFADKMMHPRYGLIRRYKVRAFGDITPETLSKLKGTLQLEDGPAKFDSFKFETKTGINAWFEVSIKEGRNRIVRRMFQAAGLTVNRLIRIQHGAYQLPKQLKPGAWQVVNNPHLG